MREGLLRQAVNNNCATRRLFVTVGQARARARIGNCKNKNKGTRKAVGENSFGAAEQLKTAFVPSKK